MNGDLQVNRHVLDLCQFYMLHLLEAGLRISGWDGERGAVEECTRSIPYQHLMVSVLLPLTLGTSVKGHREQPWHGHISQVLNEFGIMYTVELITSFQHQDHPSISQTPSPDPPSNPPNSPIPH